LRTTAIDAVDAEEVGEGADGLGETAADDGDLPAGGAELGEAGLSGRLDRRDVLGADRGSARRRSA